MKFLIVFNLCFILSLSSAVAVDRYNGHKDKDVEFAIDDGESEPELVFIDKDKDAAKLEMQRRREKVWAKKLARGMDDVLDSIREKKAAKAYKVARRLRLEKEQERDRRAAENLAKQTAAMEARAQVAKNVTTQIAASPNGPIGAASGPPPSPMALPLGVVAMNGSHKLFSLLRKRVAKRTGRSVASLSGLGAQNAAIQQRSFQARLAQQKQAMAARQAGNMPSNRSPASASQPKKSGIVKKFMRKAKVRFLQVKRFFGF